MIFNKENARHYNWGDNCDGWYLVKNDSLNIIHEKMPPTTKEKKHYHIKSRQFFFILSGKAEIEINGKIFKLNKQDGIEVEPNLQHQIMNNSNEDLEFLVISNPPSQTDRIDLE